MGVPDNLKKHLGKIEAAFKKDGFFVHASCSKDGRIGVSARRCCKAKNTFKQAYYVEGDHHTMGWLLGFMAEREVARMTTSYRIRVIEAFIDPELRDTKFAERIQKLILRKIVAPWVEKMKSDIPCELRQEMEGLLEGCRAANKDTLVTLKDLWELNAGPDAVLAHAYTGKLFARKASPRDLRVPLHCNAFAAPGTGKRRLFGRDFIFPTAHVFQDVACMIIYRPDSAGTTARHGIVSQTAPGFVGSLTALNSKGVAIGVNMTPSHLCNAGRPGFNGLMLARHCMELADSAPAAAQLIVDAQRGVAWIYPVADAKGNAFAVEAGARLGDGEEFPYLDYIPHYYRRRLPDLQYIRDMQRKYGNKPPDHGAFARAADYKYPFDFIKKWNKGLWMAYERNFLEKLEDLLFDLGTILGRIFTGRGKSLRGILHKAVMDFKNRKLFSQSYFTEHGFIDPLWTDKRCPGPFYFSPQRETRSDVLVATNNFLSPEMRLVGMNAWTSVLGYAQYDDFQWRYDELCKEVLGALKAHRRGLNDRTAWSIVNFLTPGGKFPEYHNDPQSRNAKPDWQDVEVNGSVSLCDLTGRTLKSLFGYYGDDPVTITLPNYLEETTRGG